MTPELSIILLNHKSRGLLRQCLRGLRAIPPKTSHEIIVVDNGSEDGTPEVMAREFPDIQLIVSPRNIGFGPGNNLGIRAARGAYVAILNPDIAILDAALDELVRYLDTHADVGIVGPKLVNPDRSIQYSCYRFHSPFIPLYRRTALGRSQWGREALAEFLMTDWDHGSERDVDWLLGACFLVRRALFREIGLFDERFFLYFDDTDLCRRAWEAGSRVVYQPAVSVVHYHRRESADGSFFGSLVNPVTRIHIASWIKYLFKYRGKPLPR